MKYKETFINSTRPEEIRSEAQRLLGIRESDIKFYSENGPRPYRDEMTPDVLDRFSEVGDIEYYFLGLDVQTDSAENVEYLKLLISWGGPSDEIRFYKDRTEYVFMDWGTAIGYDISGEKWADWLREYFDIDSGKYFYPYNAKREG